MSKKYLQVLVEIPTDVSISEARDYIRAELKSAGGCRPIDDPLFGGLLVVSITSVKVPA